MRKKYLKGIVAGMMVGAVVMSGIKTWAGSVDGSAKGMKKNFGEPYNPTKAVNYAAKYCGKNEGGRDAEGYNNSFPWWCTKEAYKKDVDSNKGGDCINFVSQCVAYGGFLQVDDGSECKSDGYMRACDTSVDPYWYAQKRRNGNWRATDTWFNNVKFKNYMTTQRGVTMYSCDTIKRASLVAQPGDAVQVVVNRNGGTKPIHALIVTKVDKDGTVHMAAHNSNRSDTTLEKQYNGFKDEGKITFNVFKFSSFEFINCK